MVVCRSRGHAAGEGLGVCWAGRVCALTGRKFQEKRWASGWTWRWENDCPVYIKFITISSIKEWRSFTICYRLEF